MLPLFLNLTRTPVVLVGGGPVGRGEALQLLRRRRRGASRRRAGTPAVRTAASDLDDAWLVVRAADAGGERAGGARGRGAAHLRERRRRPANATAFLSGVVRRDGVTIAISTERRCAGAHRPAARRARRACCRAMTSARWVEERKRVASATASDGGANRAARVECAVRRRVLLRRLERRVRTIEPRLVNADRQGHVSLVGAGPGDPGLLTRKAVARLRAADLVLYDALVDDARSCATRGGRSGSSSASAPAATR